MQSDSDSQFPKFRQALAILTRQINMAKTSAKTKTKKHVSANAVDSNDKARPIKDKQEKCQDYMLKLVLGGLKLDHLLPILGQHRINYLDFLRLMKKDLNALGIFNETERQQILNYIGQHANDQVQDTTTIDNNNINIPDILETETENPDIKATSPTKPLRLQNADLISADEMLQILSNISTHIDRLSGNVPNDNRELNVTYGHGIGTLRKEIEEDPMQLKVDLGNAMSTMIQYSNNVLASSEYLKQTLMKYEEELQDLRNK